MKKHKVTQFIGWFSRQTGKRMTNVTLQPVIDILEKKGAIEDQIADVVVDPIQSATIAFYSKAMEVFSEEDLIKIEEYETDEEANLFIEKLYFDKFGKRVEDEVNTFLTVFVEQFVLGSRES